MAFPLGLGSLFSNSDHPNTLNTLEPQTDSRYFAASDIQSDEDLCISHGRIAPLAIQDVKKEDPIHKENEFATRLFTVEDEDSLLPVKYQDDKEVQNPYLKGDPNEVIPQDALPFTKLKPPPDEEDPQSIRTSCATPSNHYFGKFIKIPTVKVWVVDIPDVRHIATLLKWLKQSGLDTPELGHLKRIRKQNDLTTFLICKSTSCTSDDAIEQPSLPPILDPKQTVDHDLSFPAPYIILVPASSALTLTSLALKSALWPTIYTPRRKDEPEPWTRGKLSWAWDAMKWTVDAAIKAAEQHQLPIAAHIPIPYERNPDVHCSAFTASDTRTTTRNPLRHSVLNVIRKIADHDVAGHSSSIEFKTPQNFTNYLLTDQTVFVTHEPCIMCSMALLHSRVKEVVYLYPMPKTGGCGGCACLPALKGVNHRFGILQWKLDTPGAGFCQNGLKIVISDTVDA